MKLSSSFSFSFFFGIVQFPVKLVGKSGEFSLCRRSLLYKLAHLKKSRYTYQSHNEFKSRCLSGQSSLIDYSFPKITELFFFFVFFLLLIFVIIVLRKGRWKEDFIILPNDYKTYRIFNFNNLLSIQLPSFRVRTEKKYQIKQSTVIQAHGVIIFIYLIVLHLHVIPSLHFHRKLHLLFACAIIQLYESIYIVVRQ